VPEPLPRLRWIPTGNVRTVSAANFLTGLYQNVLNVVLQRFVLDFGGGLTLLGLLQAFGGRFGLVASLVQPVGGHLADLRGRRAVAIRGSLLSMAGLALLIAAAAFRGQAWAVPALLVPAYLCAGLGMISAPALQSAVAEAAHPRARASAFATTTFFWILPGALLAIPGGVVADLLGYGALFGIAFALEAVNLVLFSRFLVETREVPLAKFMQALQFTYTRYYNRRYATSGHLFQGRYQAIVCDRDAYLVALVRYVHLNPGRLKRPVDPWRYPWSSHRAYPGAAGPVQVETAVVLGQFGNHVGRARHAYRRFMADGLGRGHEAQYYATVDQRLLGDEAFIEAVDQKTGRGREIERARRPVVFARLVRAVAQQQGVEAGGLVGPGRQRAGVGARAMLVYLGREWSQVSTKELGRQLHRDPSIISRLYWWYVANRDLDAEAKLAKVLER